MLQHQQLRLLLQVHHGWNYHEEYGPGLVGSQKGEDRRKDLALRGHTAAGTRRAGNHMVRLVGVHTQQVGTQVEVGMPRVLLVGVDTHVEEGNLVVAGTGHMEMPHIHAAHGTQTGPYLDFRLRVASCSYSAATDSYCQLPPVEMISPAPQNRFICPPKTSS